MDEKPTADKDKKFLAFEAIQDFTDKLTLRRVFSALLAGILMLSLYTAYENRTRLFDTAVISTFQNNEPKDWSVTNTAKELEMLVKTSHSVRFVFVTQVDLQKNRRTPKFLFTEDPLNADMNMRTARLLPEVVFDHDEKNTQQMVSVLNGVFTCNKFEDTAYMRNFADLKSKIPYICRMAIPPFYGRFVGILTFGLAAEPSLVELNSLRIESSRLAVQIYLKDVIRSSP